jgi:hypothetical protein
MIGRKGQVDSRAKRAKRQKAMNQAGDAAKSAVDPTRELALRTFEKIKASRERAAKLVD